MLINVIKTAINGMLFAIGFGIGLAIREFLAFPGQVIAAVRFLVITLPQILIRAWSAVNNAINHGIAVAVSAVVRFVSDVVRHLLTLGGRAVSAVASFVTGLPSRIRAAFVAAYNATVTGVTNAVKYIATLPGKAVSALSKLPGMIKGAFVSAGTWLLQAGKDIIMGLVHGIGQAAGAAVSAAKGVAGRILGGVKAALGIGSPSKEMMKVGKWTFQGFEMGIKQAAPTAIETTRNLLSPRVLAPSSSAATNHHVIQFGAGAITVNLPSSVSPTEARTIGQGIGDGIAERLKARAINSTVRTL
jgi:hypothetical protein